MYSILSDVLNSSEDLGFILIYSHNVKKYEKAFFKAVAPSYKNIFHFQISVNIIFAVDKYS